MRARTLALVQSRTYDTEFFFGAYAIVLSVDHRCGDRGSRLLREQILRTSLLPYAAATIIPGSAAGVDIPHVVHGFWSVNYVESQQRDIDPAK